MTTKTTRRSVLAGMAGGAAATAALPALAAVGTQAPDALQVGVQAVIADIRALPGSTQHAVYVALQRVADLIDVYLAEKGGLVSTPQQQYDAHIDETVRVLKKGGAIWNRAAPGAIS